MIRIQVDQAKIAAATKRTARNPSPHAQPIGWTHYRRGHWHAIPLLTKPLRTACGLTFTGFTSMATYPLHNVCRNCLRIMDTRGVSS